MKRGLLILALVFLGIRGYSQVEPLWLEDTAFLRELNVIRSKFNSLTMTGYLQVQYQHADSTGINSFNGGNFAAGSDNRFMIRRGRFRIDYDGKTSKGFYKYLFSLQFDGSERGVNIRDMFGRVYENKWNFFVATVGVFNRPFSYELNYSSSMRESPERGRMSQILMKTERDLGAMVSFEPQDKNGKWYPLKVDAGFFNGQGLAGTEEYDSFKDFITRASVRRTKIRKNLYLSAGLSYLNGGIRSGSPNSYSMVTDDQGHYVFETDSASNNLGKRLPRVYYGADIQILYESALGKTELRAEYMTGTQSATFGTSITPGSPPMDKAGKPESLYSRNFDGAYFYLLHTFLKKHQVFLKYDWYDPNTRISGEKINAAGNLGQADIRYDTFGAGYILHLNDNLKIVMYYDHPVNERSGLREFAQDLRDDTFTMRMQFRF